MNKKRSLILRVMIIVLALCSPWKAFTGFGRPATQANAIDPVLYLPVLYHLEPQSFGFIAWADTQTGTERLASLSNQVKKLNPAFTLFAGDLEVQGYHPAQIAEREQAMDGNRGNGLAEIVFPVRGNHDALFPELWQEHFHLDERAEAVGATHYTELDEDLSYSFDYENAHFVGLDVPGDVNLLTLRELAFLDQDLFAAESRGLVHAFLFFHGPVYPFINTCPPVGNGWQTPFPVVELVRVINRHPIVSAVFNGHKHIQAYVHLSSNRVPEITHPFEEFISGTAGADVHHCYVDECTNYCSTFHGFALVTVNDKNYSVALYASNRDQPVRTFSFEK